MSAKILALGPPLGSLKAFVDKQRSLQTKHNFTLCVCVGDFFGAATSETDTEVDDLLAGRLDVPLTTYIMVGGHLLPERVQQRVDSTGGEVCSNVFFIGSLSLLPLSLSSSSPSFPSLPFPSLCSLSFRSKQPAPTLASLKAPTPTGLDILLLQAPPPSLSMLSPSCPKLDFALGQGATPLGEVVRRARPRYIFWTGGGEDGFWEREPFGWEGTGSGSEGRYTRGIKIGRFGGPPPEEGKKKARSFYAFSLSPLVAPFPPRPANATPNPLALPSSRGHYIRDCPQKVARPPGMERKPELGPAECWFCLSNPKVTKHLIVAIGTETYVTLPKGQLPPTISSSKMVQNKITGVPELPAGSGPASLVPGGGHVLIIPISHHQTLQSIPAIDAPAINAEIEETKEALRDCYKEFGAVPVAFEVGRLGGRGGHAHVQVVPVPAALASKVEAAFREEGNNLGIKFADNAEAALASVGKGGGDNYFRVDLPGGGKMVHLMERGARFDLQFGRATLAKLLEIPHRIDWKNCPQTDAEEKADAVAFKKVYSKYDRSS
ncbi:CwfJ C-terminus 1-domain-containing protein-like protein [Mrakia frigida]|uniref:Drn1p n=1 Tax=Mrakia frigida TaxID=29902 RepID=UPI003FCC0A76